MYRCAIDPPVSIVYLARHSIDSEDARSTLSPNIYSRGAPTSLKTHSAGSSLSVLDSRGAPNSLKRTRRGLLYLFPIPVWVMSGVMLDRPLLVTIPQN